MRQITLLLAAFFLIISNVLAQNPKYSRVKIFTGDAGMSKLNKLGIETDHGDYRRNVWFVSDFSENEIAKIAAAGFKYEIEIDNVSEYYRNQSAQTTITNKTQAAGSCSAVVPDYPVPANFALGSMGGYFTYQEMLDNLDSMASKYPNLITIKQALPGGSTVNGQPIYYVKISDNALIDETEPEVLYTAVHHAREPGGMSQVIYYMWYLLEHYNNDPSLTALVNSTEMFFITCINPDGYEYNYSTDPNGGGMWRKNRRDNLDGTYGVDLNRNYGYNWGLNDDGSSPFTGDETYRGDVPFSEPETQLVSNFVNSREFKITLNYHTFGNLLIYPWGYDYSIYTPDSALFENYGNLLTTYNGYTYGTADQTVGYITNGSSDDWMYGDQVSKPKVFAMTPECGDAAFGFWPPSNEIIPLCQSNMFQNITMAQLAGKYIKVKETSPEFVSNGGGNMYFTIKQLGLDTVATYTLSITPITNNIVSVGNPGTHSNLSVLQEITDSISFALTTPMTNGEAIKFLLSVDNGVYVRTDTIVKYFGPQTVAFASDGNSLIGWTSSQWGNSNSVFYSPTASIADSPLGDYNSNEFSTCRISSAVDLTTAVKATLSFYARWALEPNFDYVQVQASTDNGVSWNSLCGNYTVAGSSFQVFDEPLYEGFQLSWVKEEMSLDDYVGSNVQIRFVLASDGFQEYDGYYFDDVLITKILPGTNSLQETTNAIVSTVTPNPASEYFYVNLENISAKGEIIVTDLLGKMVLKQHVEVGSSSVRINSSVLKKGIYLVRYENINTVSKPVKLVIE